MKKFSSGDLYVVGLVANDTPIKIGTLQGVDINFDQEIVRLTGANTFAEDLANGPATLTGSFEHGTIDANVVTKILAGTSVSSGYKKLYKATATIPGSPYALTSAQSSGFARDLGVLDSSSEPMTKVDSAATPSTGQYKAAAGVYTFAAADTGKSVSYSHTYTVAGSGKTVAITNTVMGSSTKYLLGLYNSSDGFGIELRSVVIPKLGWAIKTGQWVLPKCDFEACADSSGAVSDVYIP